MTDQYILEKEYTQYKPTPLDNESIVARFQKCFKDKLGKKYFIDVIKWSNNYIPVNKRDKYWEPFTYCYETQVTLDDDTKTLNLEFFSNWSLEDVEQFMENMFDKMKLDYYEKT